MQAEQSKSQWIAAGLLALSLSLPGLAFANHPVFVEGEADFDGDGRVGQAEDMDGPTGDPRGLTFGTIAGCLGTMNGGIGQNGSCFIVTSGNFVETVNITNQVTIEAAPGVIANIEAFVVMADPRLAEFPQAAPDAFALQAQPGIIINSPANRQVVLRNLVVTNWTNGIQIMGDSHVLMDNVRVDHNINNGVVASDRSFVAISNSQISSSGFRLNPRTGDFPATMAPMPGAGVSLTGNAQAEIRNTSITGTFADAISSDDNAKVEQANNLLFDNNRSRDLPAPMPAPMMMMTPPAAPPMMPTTPPMTPPTPPTPPAMN